MDKWRDFQLERSLSDGNLGSKPPSKVKRKIKYGRDMNEFFFLTL